MHYCTYSNKQGENLSIKMSPVNSGFKFLFRNKIFNIENVPLD